MRFEIVPGPQLQGKVIYRPDEYAFDFEPADQLHGEGLASVLVNDLQLEIEEDGRVLWVWGLNPYTRWTPARLRPPESAPGRLGVVLTQPVIPGVSHRLTGPGAWPTQVDPESGWVCVGDAGVEQGEAVEFATHTIAVLQARALKALWLSPELLPAAVTKVRYS